MRLIKKIEVNYLRSLYSATLDKVGDLNIVFGRNDSGKSNLLRALNLFFNEETEPGRYFDFDLDMSDRRKEEAREAKGKQFVWIKITFEVPENYRKSLGSEITIKRQWNRGGDMNQTVFPALDTAGKQARLTRLMNEIDFTYIPAIKGLNVFADLIERMYGAAAQTVALQDATTAFVDAIEYQTTTLSKQLTNLFGAPARLAPPTEMSLLFRNLDFSHGVDAHSLLRQKGDGIKARHLPELLRYINKNEPRKKFFLWGFEEPENSLDLGAAESEARRFAEFSEGEDTQIFITSHSPAFYLAQSKSKADIRRFFVNSRSLGDDTSYNSKNAVSLIDKLDEAERMMEKAGLLQLPFIIRQLDEQRRAIKEKEDEAAQLRAELSRLQQPALFVEGKHDVKLFEEAFLRIGVEGRISVKPIGGTPSKYEALFLAVIQQGGLNANSPTFLLFDNDKSGRNAFNKISSSNHGDRPNKISNNLYAWKIQFTEVFKDFLRRYEIKEDQAFFTAEFLYPANQSAALLSEILAERDDPEIEEWLKTITGDYWHGISQVKAADLMRAEPGTVDWFFARGVYDPLKGRFAREARQRDFETQYIDYHANKIAELLFN